MESEVGAHLFVRVKGRLQPTAAAQRLLPHVQRAIGHLDYARQVAYAITTAASDRLTIAVGAPVLPAIAPGVRAFQSEHGAVHLDIRTETTTTILELVSNHEADFGLSASPMQNADARVVQKCRSEVVSESEMVVILPRQHRLAARPVIRPLDLREEPIIALPSETPNMLHARAAFQQAQVPMTVRATVANSIGVSALVREGLGVGLINPLQTASGLFSDLVTRPFRPRVLLQTLAYYSRFRPLSAPAAALADCLTQALRAAVPAPCDDDAEPPERPDGGRSRRMS